MEHGSLCGVCNGSHGFIVMKGVGGRSEACFQRVGFGGQKGEIRIDDDEVKESVMKRDLTQFGRGRR